MLVAQKIHESKSLPSVQWLPAPRVKTNLPARSEAYSTLTRFFLKKNSPKMIPKSQKAFNHPFAVSDLESDLDCASAANTGKEEYRCLDYPVRNSEKKSGAEDAVGCQRRSDYRCADFLCQKIDKNFQPPDFENFSVGCHRRDRAEYRPQTSARMCNSVAKPSAFPSHHLLHSAGQNHLKSPKPERKVTKDTEHYEISFKSHGNFLFPLTEEQKFCSRLSEYKRSFDANADRSTHKSFDGECGSGAYSPLRYPSRTLVSQQDLVRPFEFACADRRSVLCHNPRDKRSSCKNFEGMIKCRNHSEPSVCNNLFLFSDKREDKLLMNENARTAEKSAAQKGSFIKRWRSLSILDLNSDCSFQSSSKASVKENIAVRKPELKNPQAFYLLEDFLLPKSDNGFSSKSRKVKNETFVSSFRENSLSPNSCCSGSEVDSREHLKSKRVTEKLHSVYLPYRQSETHSFRNYFKSQDMKSCDTSSLSSPRSFLLPSSKKYTKPSSIYHTPMPKKEAAEFKAFNGREAESSSSKVSPASLENLKSTSEWEDMDHKVFTKELVKNWELCGKNGAVDADALKPRRELKPQTVYGKKFVDPSKYASLSNGKCYTRSKQHRPEIPSSKQNLNCSDKGCPPKLDKEPCKSKKDESAMENGYKVPLTPSEALRYYGNKLSLYEKKEILQYPEIWFVGQDAKKINGEENGLQNGGYDDENGSYHKVLHDHISYRYEILGIIGKGSFGQVIKAQDHKTNHQVAIKIIRNKRRFHHQALIEVRILDHLRKKEKRLNHGVIQMLDYFYFRNHLCISFELMGMNLYELIKRNNYQGFSLPTIRKLALSVVHCLKFLRNENVIHCDLKPENILLKDKGNMELKVIDFGSSCFVQKRIYTYIQSRFYRSPEVILGMSYGTSIDMWSLGCILAELCTGYPLFPGENEAEQLASIMEILGKPSENLLAGASRRRIFFDSKGNPRSITNSKGRKRRPGSKDLAEVLKCADPVFVDFVTRCLE